MINLIKDVSDLTRVDINLLNKFVSVANWSFVNSLQQLQDEEIASFDIGIGKINAQKISDELIFNFEPNEYVKNNIYQELPVLEFKSEDRLVKKIISTYMDLLY